MPNQPDVHIVPSLLPVTRPFGQLGMFPPMLRPLEDTSSSSLSLLNRVYVFNFLPSGLITRYFNMIREYYKNISMLLITKNNFNSHNSSFLSLLLRLFIRLMKYYSNFSDCAYWRHGLCLELKITTAQGLTSQTFILAELNEGVWGSFFFIFYFMFLILFCYLLYRKEPLI